MASVSQGDVVAEKYRVERMLGRGGMGYVVAARHLTLDQLFAIKFLRKSALSEGEALARFRREAKACVRLKNEHVARVFDVGVHNDEPFIVMEHLEGADLGALARPTPNPDAVGGGGESGQVVDAKVGRAFAIGTACDYILQACEALAEAHSLGIVHRDIKLPNLFLTDAVHASSAGRGLLKVLDFGVSKVVAISENETFDVTQTAAVLGSPKYMSPEQMNDPRSVDPRTDIWSLGVCLYRLISGHAPFDGDTIGRLCTMVLHERPITLTDLRPETPPSLEALVMCCLQKNRTYRFANVAELAASLVPFASEPEHAEERAHHIATVLGVPPVPSGYLPPQPVGAYFHGGGASSTSGQSLEGAAAWAHEMVAQKKDRRRTELTIALAAASLLFGLTAFGVAVLLRGPSSARAMASQPQTTTTTTTTALAPATTTVATPTPTPTIIATVPITPTTAPTPTALSSAAPRTTTTTTPTTPTAGGARRGGHGRTTGGARTPSRGEDDGSGLAIPGDRK